MIEAIIVLSGFLASLGVAGVVQVAALKAVLRWMGQP